MIITTTITSVVSGSGKRPVHSVACSDIRQVNRPTTLTRLWNLYAISLFDLFSNVTNTDSIKRQILIFILWC